MSAQSAQQTHLPAINELPDWLLTEQPVAKRDPALLRELTDIQYTAFFETLLERLAEGHTLGTILNEDSRGFKRSQVQAWIMRDPVRKRRFYEAKALGAEAIEDQMITIADAEGSMEDVQRSALRINTRFRLLEVWDRERYGSKHTVVSEGKDIDEDRLTKLAERLKALQPKPVTLDEDGEDVTDVEAK